ncbi:XTP/dITP diphosphatase [bacterium]|nr:XTP/dITP diphosphatase [bacterium]
MNTRLVLATANQGKLKELQALLKESRVELATLRDFPRLTMPEETGLTFVENAKLKAQAVVEATGCWALSDDSGLVVDALDGAPGVYSARYAGFQASDTENNQKLLQDLAQIPDEKRNAAFVCVVVIASPDTNDEYIFTGSCQGRIAREPTGYEGFGYDPVFLPAPKFNFSMAQLTPDEKSSISHRGQALEQLKLWLNS